MNMGFILEYFEIIVLFLFIVVFGFLVVLTSYSHFFSKHFSNRKFNIRSGYQIEPTSKTSRFVITIYNNNINDTRITGFGFIYQNQSIDYFKTHLQQKNLLDDGKVVIPSRDFVSAQVDDKDLETIVLDINRGKYRVSRLMVFVTDSLGLTTKAKARQIRKQLQLMLTDKRNAEIEKVQAIHLAHQAEMRIKRHAKRMEYASKRQERWQKFLFWVKTTFAKKKK